MSFDFFDTAWLKFSYRYFHDIGMTGAPQNMLFGTVKTDGTGPGGSK